MLPDAATLPVMTKLWYVPEAMPVPLSLRYSARKYALLPTVGSESVSPVVYVDQLMPSVDFYRYSGFDPPMLSRRTVLFASCAVKHSGFATAVGSTGTGGEYFSQPAGIVLYESDESGSSSGHVNVP